MIGPELRIDLDALAANIAVVRTRVAPAELLLVVKDDAYGHGLAAVVRRATAEGVRWFGAFTVDEAIRTRANAGPDVRVFSWLTVGGDQIGEALRADIDLGVGDAAFLEDVAAVSRSMGVTARVHLKIDTGLHRNGVRPEDWAAVIARAGILERAGGVRIVGIWSHIAEASDEEDDAARSIFDAAVDAAEGAGFRIEVRHLSASAASSARPEFRYDLVRVGAFCYGIRSAGGSDGFDPGVRPIASLVAPVSRVDAHVVALGIGALHGLPSTLAARAHLAGRFGRADIVRVEDDHTIVSAVPGLRSGDEVTFFGPDAASATDLAESIDTVGEEILVRVSPLVPRVYREV
jgi:alanine racemase